jgi:hypothetical protein
MSVEADFGITPSNFQANGSQLSWDITWPGILDNGRFAGVSFLPDSNQSQLVRVSESFANDINGGLHVGEVVQANGDSVFRFSVVIIPNH